MLRLTDTEYALKHVVNKKVTIKYEIVANVPELKKLISEFRKIFSNLNQITQHKKRLQKLCLFITVFIYLFCVKQRNTTFSRFSPPKCRFPLYFPQSTN